MCVRDRTVTPRSFWDVATGLGEDVEKRAGDGGLSYKNMYLYLHGDYKPKHIANKINKLIKHSGRTIRN